MQGPYQYYRENVEILGEKFGWLAHVPTILGLGARGSKEEAPAFPGFDGTRAKPESVMVYDITNATQDQEIQARVLQGILNRQGPNIYLIQTEADRFWLDSLSCEKTEIPDLAVEMKQIKYDSDSLLQTSLAITLAGLEKAVPVVDSENPIKDLTGLDEDGMYLEFIEASEKTNPHMISFRGQPKFNHIDLVVKNQMLLSPLAISGDLNMTPVKHKSTKERQVLEKIMERMEPDFAMVGYNINPEIAGEYETINFLAKRGGFSIPVPSVANLSFFSSLPKKTYAKETTVLPNEVIEEPKAYLAFAFSDGDNLKISYGRYGNFLQEHNTPVAWSISPFLSELAPNILEVYKNNLQAGDTLVAGPSGAGFTYPSVNKNLPSFLEHTKRYVDECGLKYLWLLDFPVRGYSKQILQRFTELSEGILAEYATKMPYLTSINTHCDIPTIFSSAMITRHDEIVEKITHHTPNNRPAYLFFTLNAWHISPEELDQEVAKLGEEYKVLRLPDFMHRLEIFKGKSSITVESEAPRPAPGQENISTKIMQYAKTYDV